MNHPNLPPHTTLILKLLYGTITPDETKQLHAWISADTTGRRAALVKMLQDNGELTREYRQRHLADTENALHEMETRIHIAGRPLRHRRAITAAAASIALLLCCALWYLSSNTELSRTDVPTIADTVVSTADSSEIIRPGVTKAVLWQQSGSSIRLGASDSITDTRQLMAKRSDICPMSPEHLCLEVPRGGEFRIMLEDSTVVWLNSESTLRYPETFGPGERRVEVTGEAYFAVHKDEHRPFYVESRGQTIRVYGTTFNVRSYADDNNTYTTLETGSIALRKNGLQSGEIYLSPGHQAIFNKTDSTLTMTTVNPEIITSWRHGRFVFEGQTLNNIMHDLARWYDFEFEFTEPTIADISFNGSIPRYADFNTAITILENCGAVSFNITGNKVTISHL